MALELIKLSINAATTTAVTPDDTRFFYINTTDVPAGSNLTINVADFLDDTGAAPAALPALATNNSYFNVYINGVLQMEGNSTYTSGAAGSLVFSNPAGGGTIFAGQPVVLEVVNFTPASTTTVQT